MKIPGNKVFLSLTIIGFVILALGILFGFIFFDLIINDQIYKNVRLKEGTDQYERWRELPLDVNYKVYMFNVTNVEEIMNDPSAVPIVEEVGPYVYKQSRVKQNISYDKDEDILQYVQYMHFRFDEEESFPHKENDTITMVNVLLNAYFNIASSLLPEELHLLLDVFWRYIFADVTTLFHTVEVGDILFNGYKFCQPEITAQDPDGLTPFLCIILSYLNLNVLEADDDGSMRFSFFNFKQDKHDGIYTVNAGNKDVSKLGLITSWESRTYLDTWKDGTSKCNKVTGRDSTIYQPHIKENEEILIFATELCRVANLYHVGEEEVLDIKGQKKVLREDTFYTESIPENECFCVDSTRDLYGEQKCLPDGFFDLQPCLGAPIVASFPHFLHATGNYTSTVIGLEPNPEDHQTYLVVEPGTGTPLAGYKRIQFNAILRPIRGVSITQVKNSIVPILWVEEGVLINDEYADMMKDMYFYPLSIVEILKWVLIGVGAVVFAVFGGLYFYTTRT